MSSRAIDIIESVAGRVEQELLRLQQIEEIAKSHPEWLDQEPRLRVLLIETDKSKSAA